MKSFLLAALLVSVASPTAAMGQSLAGEWDATMETPGGARTLKVLLQVEGERVTGTVKRPAGDAPLVGTIKGDTLTFRYSITYEGNSLELTVSALVKKDSFQGTVDFGGGGQAAFSATRAPGAAKQP